MEPEVSLPHSQEPGIYPYSEPDQSSPRLPSSYCNIDFNIFLPSKSRSSKWFPSSRFIHKSAVYISLLPHTCHMPCPTQIILGKAASHYAVFPMHPFLSALAPIFNYEYYPLHTPNLCNVTGRTLVTVPRPGNKQVAP